VAEKACQAAKRKIWPKRGARQQISPVPSYCTKVLYEPWRGCAAAVAGARNRIFANPGRPNEGVEIPNMHLD